MSGPNQHHIPQFLQRAFGVPRSGKPRDIWEYRKDTAPALSEIKHTAAEDYFYSLPRYGDAETLDDRITEVETPLSRKVHALRLSTLGTVVDHALAAEVLTHLAPRTAHLRSVFSEGLSGLVEGMRSIFADGKNFAALLGIDGDQPSARFRDHFDNHVKTDPLLAQIGLPSSALEQVSFRLAKENFSRFVEEQIPQIHETLSAMAQSASHMAREGHNSALSKMITEGSGRADLLDYEWSVEEAPFEGAILPDCVAIAWLDQNEPRPFMGADSDATRAITMPLSTNRLLVGVRASMLQPSRELFNEAAASCSHTFFLAATDQHASLAGRIGATATTDMTEGLQDALGDFLVKRAPTAEQAPLQPEMEQEEPNGSSASGNFSYQVSCRDFGDDDLVRQINNTLRYIVSELALVLPLERLDGITFAADYPTALAAVNRGRPNVAPAKTVSEDIGVGVAMTVAVDRDGILKGHVVFASGIGLMLISDVDADNQLALHLLVHELAEVAQIQLFDEAFPGVLLEPLSDPYEGRLLASVINAVDGYIAARVSACFGDREQIMRTYQELLISTLALAHQNIPEARLAYRYDGDMHKLLAVAQPLVEHILSFTAKMLGHADGLGSSPFDEEGSVKDALERAGLWAWIRTFETDLRNYWDRRRQWSSLDELFRFNRHFERVFWQFGMFWSAGQDRETRIHIPLTSDALQLLQATANGVPVPNFPPVPVND